MSSVQGNADGKAEVKADNKVIEIKEDMCDICKDKRASYSTRCSGNVCPARFCIDCRTSYEQGEEQKRIIDNSVAPIVCPFCKVAPFKYSLIEAKLYSNKGANEMAVLQLLMKEEEEAVKYINNDEEGVRPDFSNEFVVYAEAVVKEDTRADKLKAQMAITIGQLKAIGFDKVTPNLYGGLMNKQRNLLKQQDKIELEKMKVKAGIPLAQRFKEQSDQLKDLARKTQSKDRLKSGMFSYSGGVGDDKDIQESIENIYYNAYNPKKRSRSSSGSNKRRKTGEDKAKNLNDEEEYEDEDEEEEEEDEEEEDEDEEEEEEDEEQPEDLGHQADVEMGHEGADMSEFHNVNPGEMEAP